MALGRKVGGYDGENVTGIGYVLGEARKKRGLGLKAVSSVLGVSVQFVSNIEHGRAPLPAKYVEAISKLLDLDQNTVAGFALQKTHSFRTLEKTVEKNV